MVQAGFNQLGLAPGPLRKQRSTGLGIAFNKLLYNLR
jgi:hypothetical protein